jgi:hypothetical protein
MEQDAMNGWKLERYMMANGKRERNLDMDSGKMQKEINTLDNG